MNVTRAIWLNILAPLAVVVMMLTPASAQQQKPNILFIMGDDIGWMQPSIYHRGLMVGETPNIDRIGNEGAIFMDYVAMQSCTSGRNAFFTGISAAHRHDPPATSRQPLLLAARHPSACQVPDRSWL
jgi:arylsulfatase A-like enzyme